MQRYFGRRFGLADASISGSAPVCVSILDLRGGLSTLLSEESFAEMQRRAPNADAVTVADAGHAPTLDEPEVRSAIEALLSSTS